ncbi:unnamed protein product [Camellia sinensis]
MDMFSLWYFWKMRLLLGAKMFWKLSDYQRKITYETYDWQVGM